MGRRAARDDARQLAAKSPRGPRRTVVIVGAGFLVEASTGGNVPFWLGALLAFLVAAVYVAASGLRGIGWTNVLQGILMVVVAWGVGLAIPWRFYGGVGAMFDRPEPAADAAGQVHAVVDDQTGDHLPVVPTADAELLAVVELITILFNHPADKPLHVVDLFAVVLGE